MKAPSGTAASGDGADSAWQYPLVFLTGAAVLVLEILGTRLIAPFYGSTIYVWSALITVTLAALAVGYAVGGSLADRPKPLTSLCWMLAASGGWVLLLPFARRPVLLGLAGLGVQAGALASAAALFALPLLCLGAVGPLVIRLRTRELGRLGREVGKVNSVSTLGSVLGALAAGFYLIPQVSVGRLLTGLSLLLLGLAAFCAWRLKGGGGARAASASLLALALAVRLTEPARAVADSAGDVRVREMGESFYGAVKVVDRLDWGKRVLYIDGIANTVVDLRDLESTSDYITSFELLHFYRPAARKALLLGLGGGSLVGRFGRLYGIRTDVVDIDPSVPRLARAWFNFRPTGRVVLEDGRRFIEGGSELYDLIVVDAFNGDQHPYHLFSVEALRSAKRRLAPGGVLALNVIGYGLGPRARLRYSMERTLREVFGEVRVLAANRDLDIRKSFLNLTCFASDSPLVFQKDPASGPERLAAYYRAVSGQFLEPEPARPAELITDEFNPIETLSAPAFVEIRGRLMDYNREVLAHN